MSDNLNANKSTKILALSPIELGQEESEKPNIIADKINDGYPLAAKDTCDEEPEEKLVLKTWSQEWLWEIRGSIWTIIATVTLAIFTDVFVYAIIVPVVPFSFVERMGIDSDNAQSEISKALSIYSVGIIVGSFLFGYISDKLKRRQILMVAGLGVLLGSTAILMLAKVMWLYFVGRLIQGLSAAIVWTVGLAIVADSGDADNMAFLMSFPSSGTAIGLFLGPFVGGIAYQRDGYYAVFYICFGILVLDVFLRLFMLEKSQLVVLRHSRALQLNQLPNESLSENDKKYRDRYLSFKDDTVEYRTRMVELQKQYGEKITLFGKTFNLPIIIAILKDARISNAVFLGVVMGWITAAIDATMTLHLKETFHFNSLQAGLVFLALAAPTAIEPVAGKISDLYGSKYTISGGFLMTVPFFILLRIPDHRSTGQIVMFVAFVVLTGAMLMFVMAPCMAEMTKGIARLESKHPGIYGKAKGFGQGYGIYNVGFSLGSLCGPLQAGQFKNHFGWKWMVVSLAVISAIAAIVSFFFAGDSFKFGRQREASEKESNSIHTSQV